MKPSFQPIWIASLCMHTWKAKKGKQKAHHALVETPDPEENGSEKPKSLNTHKETTQGKPRFHEKQIRFCGDKEPVQAEKKQNMKEKALQLNAVLGGFRRFKMNKQNCRFLLCRLMTKQTPSLRNKSRNWLYFHSLCAHVERIKIEWRPLLPFCWHHLHLLVPVPILYLLKLLDSN